MLTLNGSNLTRADLVGAAHARVHVALCENALGDVRRCADFLAAQVARREPIYGVSTGFGSNADRLLGAHRARDELPGGNPEQRSGSLMDELQHNLVISHAVCVGKPFSAEVVRAMMVIRLNTLMRGHSGVRVEVLRALADLINAGVVPVIPELGSVGASGDLAPLSHLALVLLGGGEAFFQGARISGALALEKAGLTPLKLTFKEGLGLNNGTAQMLACAALALDRVEKLLALADDVAAMSLDAFAGRRSALDEGVHALRPHPGQVESAKRIREALAGSTLCDIPYHLVPRFRPWKASAWRDPIEQKNRFDLAWEWLPPGERHGREKFYERFMPFKGGKKHQPQDSYSFRCAPQVHGAVRDAWAQACRVIDVELNAVTDNPLIFPEREGDLKIEQQVISAGHFHGMPLALVMSYLKAALPVLASISERRLNKLLDPATNDGLPAFLTGNEDATDSGLMIIQYTAAALVNDLATRAHPASVYSIPTSANAEDHVSMGANEARHVLEMTEALSYALALEWLAAGQALDYRRHMLNAARRMAARGDLDEFLGKIERAPTASEANRQQFEDEVRALMGALAASEEFHPGVRTQALLETLRAEVSFLDRDRALDGDVKRVTELVERMLAA